MKRTLLFVCIILFCSCARFGSSCNRSIQTGPRNYEIIMYSGGDTVFYDKTKSIVNSSKESDGIYYYKGDTLVEVSGDYVLKSIK